MLGGVLTQMTLALAVATAMVLAGLETRRLERRPPPRLRLRLRLRRR